MFVQRKSNILKENILLIIKNKEIEKKRILLAHWAPNELFLLARRQIVLAPGVGLADFSSPDCRNVTYLLYLSISLSIKLYLWIKMKKSRIIHSLFINWHLSTLINDTTFYIHGTCLTQPFYIIYKNIHVIMPLIVSEIYYFSTQFFQRNLSRKMYSKTLKSRDQFSPLF